MATLKPAYRLTLYAPRSVDPTEATVLTPAAGAVHSDPFKVATITGVAGFQPYLDTIRGRGGRLDLAGRRLDIGTRTVTLIDKQVTGNLGRWWSAFFGDAKGRPRGKLKALLEESLDSGATWSTYMVGRVESTKLDGKVRAALELRDEAEAMSRKVFTGQPHASITYVATPTLLPLGIVGSDYGLLKAARPMTGAAKDMTVSGVAFLATPIKIIALDAASVSRTDNFVTDALTAAVAPNSHPMSGSLLSQMIALPNFSGPCRARIKHTSGALVGQTGDYLVGMLNTSAATLVKAPRVVGFAIAALAPTDMGALALPAAGVTVEVCLFVDLPATDGRPLLINDVDPATLLQDMADGKFGYLWRSPATLPPGKSYGDVTWTVAANGLAAQVGTRPPFRGVIKKSDTFQNWVEKNLLKQYHWAPYLDRLGRLNIVDLRLPSSLAGIATLVDADIETGQDLGWEHDPSAAISRADVKRYLDTPVTVTYETHFAFINTSTKVVTGNLEERQIPLIVLDVGSFDFGDETYEIDANGYRSMDGEALQNQDRGVYLERQLIALTNQLRWPFAWGLTTITLKCRRTATVNALSQGSLVLLAASVVPDPTTHARGGTRLCMVLEFTEDGATTALRLVDLAVNAVAAVPSLAAPAQETGNTHTGVTSVLTLNASGQPVEVRYAVTDTSVGSAPADTSALWAVIGVFKAAGTVIIRNVPPGMRVWVQGRALPAIDFEPQLPSVWALAAGGGFVDTAALPAPSSPTTAAITGQSSARTRRVSWTNGATDVMTTILLATPVGDPRVQIATLLPGSTHFDLRDLIPVTTYRVGVRHSLGGRFYSAEVTADFTTDSTGVVAPAMGGVSVLD